MATKSLTIRQMSTTKNEHNPDILTPEQYGAPEWRLLNHGEPQQLGDEWWNDIKQCWEPNDESDVGFSYNHHAIRRRITPPTDTMGSGREGETPETDAIDAAWDGNRHLRGQLSKELFKHARQLERQRDAAIAQLEALRLDGERLQWMIDHAAMVYKMQRATKRRDPFSHMETVWVVAYTDKNGGEVWGSVDHGHTDPRAAIDSAQRQEAK